MKHAVTIGCLLFLSMVGDRLAAQCPYFSPPVPGTASDGPSAPPPAGPSAPPTTYEPPPLIAPAATGTSEAPRGSLSRRGEVGAAVTGGRAGRAPCATGERGARTGGAAFVAGLDRWDVWWEANKFDFIELGADRDGPASQRTRYRAGPLDVAALRERVVPALRGLASSDDAAVRAAAAVALGRVRDHESIDLVQQLLGDGALPVRRAAMLSLGVMDSGRGAYALMSIAHETPRARDLLGTTAIQVDDRGSALLSAALRGDDSAALIVSSLLAEPHEVDAELLATACDAAGLMGQTDHVGALIGLARDERLAEFVRSTAVSALGRIADPFAVPTLVELLDAELEPRRAAAIALGYAAHGGERAVVERLADALADADAPTRHFAAMSLGRLGGEPARTALAAAFRKATSDMRPWLALALALCERDAPTGTLCAELTRRLDDEPSSETQGAYLVALGLCRSGDALELLARAARGGNAEVAGYAALALGLSGHTAAGPILRDVLAAASSPAVLRQAAFALGILGQRASLPALVELIRTTNNVLVAGYAALAVAFVGDVEATGPLLDLIDREGPTGVTTTFAAAAMGQLFDSDPRPALSRLAAGDNYLSRAAAVEELLALGF